MTVAAPGSCDAIIDAEVESLTEDGGRILARIKGRTIAAACVIIAAGVIDVQPPLPEPLRGVREGLIRHCAICDGYEMTDRPLAVIGASRKALGTAVFAIRGSKSTLARCSKSRVSA